MSLPAGTHLGVDRITAHIGAGGMREVYHARDTRLGREVALQILPDTFANDPPRTGAGKATTVRVGAQMLML